MANNADVLVNFQGIDNVSPVAQQIQGSMGQMGGGIRGTLSQLGSIFSGLNGLVMGVFGGMGLSTFKNMTYGTATAREQVKQLFETVAGSTEDANSEAGRLWDTMDAMTNMGYVSLDQLAQAMNIFGMSAGASVSQMSDVVGVVNEIGNRAVLMGYDANRTQLLMNGVADGINGNTRMLNNAFGITKDKLENLGWDGTAKDMEGYVNALKEYLGIDGETQDHLDNTQGKVMSLQKRFRVAGRELGNAMLPVVNAVIDKFTELNAESGDALAQIIILSTGAMSAVASILPTLSPLLQTYDFLEQKLSGSRLFNIGNLFTRQKKEVTSFDNILKLTGNTFSASDPTIRNYGNRLTNIVQSSKDWVAVPLANYLSNTTKRAYDFAGAPITRVLREWGGYLRNFGTSIRTYMIPPFTNAIRNMTSPAVTRVRGTFNTLGNAVRGVGNRYTEWASKWGSASATIRQGNNLLKAGEKASADYVSTTSTLSKITSQSATNISSLGKSITAQSEAVRVHSDMVKLEAGMKELDRIATEGDLIANMALKDQQAINSITTLYNAGVIDEETLSKEYNAIVTAQQTTEENMGFITKIRHATATTIQRIAEEGLTIATIKATIAEYAFLAPIILIIGAIVGLILVIYELGRQLGWWTTWGGMIDAVVAGIQRLWSAFINNPNVQGFISDLQWIFGQLWGVVTDVALAIMNMFGIEDNGEEVDFVGGIINVFGALGDMLGKIVNGLKWLEQEFHVFSTIAMIITAPIRAIVDVIRTIYCIIWGCSPGVIPALRRLHEVFREIFGRIMSFIGNPVGYIVGQFNNLLDALGPVGDVIRQAIQTALPIIANVLKVYISTVGQILGTINDMLTGKISAKEGITRLINIIRPLLLRIYQIVREIMGRIIRYMVQSALNMVNGFVNNLLSLPRRVLGIFTGLINSLKQLPSQLWNTAVGLGQDLYNGVDSTLRSWTGGAIGLPRNDGQGQSNARTVNNASKNYNNTRKSSGHTIHVHEGAIQMDARNLTTKESQQVMINALHGLKSMALTKQPQGTK